MITQERLDELRNEIGGFIICGHDISDVLDEIERLRSLVPPAELMEEAAGCCDVSAEAAQENGAFAESIQNYDTAAKLRDFAQRIKQGNGK